MLRGAEPGRSRALRLLRRAVLIEPGELRPVLLAGAFFFCVLASYGVLCPIRDEMAVRGDTRNLPWLFTGTLAGMLLLHPLFTSLVSRTSRARFIQLCYRFFALNLIAFYFAIEHASPAAQVWIGRAFFIWTSVFNLFVVSVFWGFVVDVFRSDQAKRVSASAWLPGSYSCPCCRSWASRRWRCSRCSARSRTSRCCAAPATSR